MDRRLALVALPLLLHAGCKGCADTQEYGWPIVPAGPEFDSPDHFGSWVDLDVAPDGERVTMTYYDHEFTAAGFALGTKGVDDQIVWRHEPVDGYPDVDGNDPLDRGTYGSHKVASDGTVWFAYHDKFGTGVFVSRRMGGPVWSDPVVADSTGGEWISLAMDEAEPVIAHADPTTASVRVVRIVDGLWAGADVYTSNAVTVSPDTGLPSVRLAAIGQIALDVDEGTEYIAFRDDAAQTLVLLEGRDGSYTTTTVDDTGDVGAWASIDVDSGRVRIAYQDVGNQDLKLATREEGGTSFTLEVVDDGELRGADTEVFDEDGEPRVLYFDGWDNDLLLATQTAGVWSIEQLGGTHGAIGFHNAFAVTDADVWVASFDMTHEQLFFRNRSGEEPEPAEGTTAGTTTVTTTGTTGSGS
jgi:hypothetical protein